MSQFHRLLLSALVLATAFPGAAYLAPGDSPGAKWPAAKPAREYRDLPVGGNLATVLKDQLLEIKDREVLQDLVNDIRNNPKKQKNLPDRTALLKLGDSAALDKATLARLETLVKNNGGNLKFTPEQRDAVQHALKKKREELQTHQPGTLKGDPGSPNPPPIEAANAQQPSLPAANGEDGSGFDNLAKDTLSWMEHTHFAKLDQITPKSAAFQRSKERAAGNDPFGKALAKINLRGASNLSFPKPNWLELLRPQADGLKSAVPDFGPFSDSEPLPLPDTWTAPGGLPLQSLLAVALASAAAVVFWNLLARRAAHRSALALASLGPWPVHPGQVSTSEQVIQAFEYLALLKLGNLARTANHRGIAARLGATPERRRAAEGLALLYEKARYDPLAGKLPMSDLAAARRALCFLAGLRETVSAPGAR